MSVGYAGERSRCTARRAIRGLALLVVASVLRPLPLAATQSPVKPDTLVRRLGPPVHRRGGIALLTLTLGDGDSSADLARPTMVLPARDGTVWVVDSEGLRKAIVRQYGVDGRYLRTLGGLGDGPGEYRGASGIAQLPNGKIVLRNDATGNVQVYSETGKYETTWVVGRAYPFSVGGIGGLVTDTRGIVWVRFWIPMPRNGPATQAHRTRKSAFLRLRGSSGAILDTVHPPADIPTPSITARGNGAYASIPIPNTARHNWAVHRQGFIVSLLSSKYAIDLLVRPDDLNSVAIQNEVPLKRQPAEPLVSLRRDVEQILLNPAELAQLRKSVDTWARRLPFFETLDPIPPLSAAVPPLGAGLIFTDDRRIWVSVVSTRADAVAGELKQTTFDVFESPGRYLGRVDGLPTARIAAVRGDDVWVTTQTADGIPIVMKYSVVWR